MAFFAYDQIRVKAAKLLIEGISSVMRLSSPKMQDAYKKILSGAGNSHEVKS
jgi:hypothetical protein